MAETYARDVTRVQKWTAEFQEEWVRLGPFKRFMSTSGGNIINVNDTDLKGEGESVDFPFVSCIRGDGVTGNQMLEGAEDDSTGDSHRIFIDWYRQAKLPTKKGLKATVYDQLSAYRSALKMWADEKVKNALIAALCSVGYEIATTSKSTFNNQFWNYMYPASPTTLPGSTGYAAATQLNAFAVKNGPVTGSHLGRLLFGAATSNYSATWATALGNIDTSADKMTYSILDIAKNMAIDDRLNPRIAPYTGNNRAATEETFVCLMHPTAFQQLRDSLLASGTMLLQQAEVRGRDNPLFKGGDLYWNGILCTSVPGLPIIAGGAASSGIVPSFLCGRNALGLAWGQLPRPVSQDRDYGFRQGVGIEMQFGAEKLLYFDTSTGLKTQQMISIFTSTGAAF